MVRVAISPLVKTNIIMLLKKKFSYRSIVKELKKNKISVSLGTIVNLNNEMKSEGKSAKKVLKKKRSKVSCKAKIS